MWSKLNYVRLLLHSMQVLKGVHFFASTAEPLQAHVVFGKFLGSRQLLSARYSRNIVTIPSVPIAPNKVPHSSRYVEVLGIGTSTKCAETVTHLGHNNSGCPDIKEKK